MASSVRQAHTRFTAGKAPRRQRTLKHENHERGEIHETRAPPSCPSLPFVSFVIQTSLHNRDLFLHQPTQLNRQHVSLRASTESLSPLKPLRSLKPLQCDHSSQCSVVSPLHHCNLHLRQLTAPQVPFALHQPQAQPLKVARRELVEGQGASCAGDRRLGWVKGLSSPASLCLTINYRVPNFRWPVSQARLCLHMARACFHTLSVFLQCPYRHQPY